MLYAEAWSHTSAAGYCGASTSIVHVMQVSPRACGSVMDGWTKLYHSHRIHSPRRNRCRLFIYPDPYQVVTDILRGQQVLLLKNIEASITDHWITRKRENRTGESQYCCCCCCWKFHNRRLHPKLCSSAECVWCGSLPMRKRGQIPPCIIAAEKAN